MAILNPFTLRQKFPFFTHKNPSYIYLDNAATTHKLQSVIEAEQQFYFHDNANIHRANHFLARKATDAFEAVRTQMAQFIRAKETAEIIWTRGTTESINLVAYSYGLHFLHEGDEILISAVEHHSNIVPWQLIAQTKKLIIKVIPIEKDGTIDLVGYRQLFTKRTRLVCLCHVSNALGTINPIKRMIDIAHEYEALTVIDGAQAIAHLPVDVTALDCDFYAFSGHKMYGPTGIGVLYGKRHLLEKMPPYQGGGEMIESVRFSGTTFNTLPFKFEAGTPNIAGVMGLKAALEFFKEVDRQALMQYEDELLQTLYQGLTRFEGCRILSPKAHTVGLISFIVEGVHHSDIATLLDEMQIAVRSGKLCAMPAFEALNIEGAVRVSIACYTTKSEIEAFLHALEETLFLLRS